MSKIKTLEEYVAENNFLQEATEFHSKLEKDLAVRARFCGSATASLIIRFARE